MASEWFYAKDGQKFGPVSAKRLKELATLGILRRNDLIWSPGYSVWRPAKKFRGLLPKMDATSFNPAMSLFWKPVDLDGNKDKPINGLFLEPNSPATAITPPLPGSGKNSPPRSPASVKASGTAYPSSARRAGVAEVVSEAALPPLPPRPPVGSARRVAAMGAAGNLEVSRPGLGGMTSKEKVVIAVGLFAMLLIYGVLMVRALI